MFQFRGFFGGGVFGNGGLTPAQEAELANKQDKDLTAMNGNLAIFQNGETIDGGVSLNDLSSGLRFIDNWNANTNTPTLPLTPTAPTYKQGDYYIVTVAGTFNGIDFTIGDHIAVALDNTTQDLKWVLQDFGKTASQITIQGTFTPSNTAIITGQDGKTAFENTQGQLNVKVDVSSAQSFTNEQKRQGSYNINGTPFFTEVERDALSWNDGDFIFNTTAKVQQEYQSGQWISYGGISYGGFDSVPIGMVNIWSAEGQFPTGWLLLDGQEVLASEYPELAVARPEWVIGSNIKLPNFQGQFLRGYDPSGTIDPDGATRVIAQTVQGQSTARPTNPFVTNTTGSHTHQYTRYYANTEWASNAFNTSESTADETQQYNWQTTEPAGNHFHSITSGGDTETRPKNIAVHYIVKAKTTVPVQNEIISGENVTITPITVGNTIQHKIDVALPNVLNPNILINGDFQIWQRGEIIIHPGGVNVIIPFADRSYGRRGSSHTGQIVSKQLDSTFHTFARIQRAEGDALSGDLNICEYIKTHNVKRIAGKEVTLSAWIKLGADFSANSGVVGLSLRGGSNANAGRIMYNTGYTDSFTSQVFTSTTKDVWQKVEFTITIPANIQSLHWQATAANMQGIAGVNDYFDIANVKLELGTVATEFGYRSYEEALQECLPYFERIKKEDGILNVISDGYRSTATVFSSTLKYDRKIRQPIITVSNPTHLRANGLVGSAFITDNEGLETTQIKLTTASSTAGIFGNLQFANEPTAYIDIDAELN